MNPHALLRGNPEGVLVFIGDSITEGYGIKQDQAYPALLEKKVKKELKKNYRFVNASASGSTSSSGHSRLKWQLKGKPTHLILALGANDGLRGIPVAKTYENLEKTIKLAKANKMQVLLTGMKMPPNYGAEFTASFEKIFPSLASKHSVIFMPFLLAQVAGEKSYNLSDGIHPNEEGHKIIAKNMWPHIKKLLTKS